MHAYNIGNVYNSLKLCDCNDLTSPILQNHQFAFYLLPSIQTKYIRWINLIELYLSALQERPSQYDVEMLLLRQIYLNLRGFRASLLGGHRTGVSIGGLGEGEGNGPYSDVDQPTIAIVAWCGVRGDKSMFHGEFPRDVYMAVARF
jgi:hypothetical protein